MVNSTDDQKSRYSHSEEGATKSTGRFLDFYERRNIDSAEDDIVFTIPLEMENRPDKISNHFYSSPKYMWVVLMRNDIKDPLTELVAGKRISVPSINRLYTSILN